VGLGSLCGLGGSVSEWRCWGTFFVKWVDLEGSQLWNPCMCVGSVLGEFWGLLSDRGCRYGRNGGHGSDGGDRGDRGCHSRSCGSF
jgi:hypothetical protein